MYYSYVTRNKLNIISHIKNTSIFSIHLQMTSSHYIFLEDFCCLTTVAKETHVKLVNRAEQ